MVSRAQLVGIIAAIVLLWTGVGLAISGGVGVSGTVTIDAADGPSVDVATNGGELLLDGATGDNTVEVTHDNGEIVFESTGGSQAVVDTNEITGDYSRVTSIDASNDLTIKPDDKPAVTVGGGIDSVEFGSMAVDDGTRDFSYSASSSASITVNDIGATSETVTAVAGDGTVLDQTTADSSGTATFDSLDSGTYDVQLLTTSDPVLSGAAPTGGTTVSETPVQLNISVSDADFPTSQGDSVTVEFTNEDTGSTIGTDTLTSNGTATATFDSPQGGANNWSATATDSYGNTVSSQTFTFNAPSELEIRDEESPGTLLTDANVTIEFYPQGADRSDVVTRPATDGTVDMTGLDVDSDFIAVAKADGYANRRIYVESLIETQEIYLLNESSDTVDIQFELEDFSGEYQQDSSVLIVEREINGQMTPVQGDFFGATGRWEATLKRDTRHRIRIKNLATGQVRTLGPFTPQTSGVQTVTVEPDGAVQLNPEFSQVSAQPALGVIPAEDQAVFGVEIEEGDETINSYSIEVRHMDQNGTATTLATRTGTGASVEEFTLNLTGLQGQVIANVDVETDSGTRSVVVSREIRESYPGADGLLGGLLEVGSGLGVGKETGASGASSMAAFFLSVLVTGAVARQTRASADLTGLTALGSLTAFAIIGWLSMQVLFAVAVAFAGALTLRRGI